MKIAPFGVELWLNENETKARLNLAETSISALSVRELVNLCGLDESTVMEEIFDTRLSYGDILGSERLLGKVSKLYKDISPDQIALTHGTIGANQLAHLVLTGAGEHIIAFSPSYDQHAAIAESIGADVTVLPLTEENRYLPDLEELRAAVRPDTKLICLTNPNNPTGTLMDAAMLGEVAEMAREVGAYVLSDEVYRGVEAAGVETAPSIVDIYEKGVATCGLSKAFSLPGLRIGWLVAPLDLMSQIGDHRDYSIISVGGLDDLLGSIALENKEALLERSRGIINRNRAIVEEWLDGEPRVSWVAPDASSAALLKIEAPVADREFATGLLEKKGVLLTPGSAFGIEGHYRLGYTCEADILREGLAEISAYLDELS